MLGVWSSGMILASGARGREFDSRNTPFSSASSPSLMNSHVMAESRTCHSYYRLEFLFMQVQI